MKPASILFIAALSAFVSSVSAQTGRSAYEFLEIPTSSRVMGLGGCNVSLVDSDVMISQQNPALLGAEIGSTLGISYMHYMGSANFAGARFAHSVGERGAWAAGIRYLNYGEISGYDQTGSFTGSFTPVDMVCEGTFSHDFTDRLRGGISLKMLYSNYEQYSAFALAADLGINYYDPDHDLSVSAVLKNMGGQLKRFEDKYDHLPFDVQIGLTKGLGESFSLSVTAWNLTKWHLPYYSHSDSESHISKKKESFGSNLMRHLVFGMEYMPAERFYLDLGYNYKTRTDMNSYRRNFFSGFSLGAGFRARAFNVGVAYAMPHKKASTLLLNVGLDIEALR